MITPVKTLVDEAKRVITSISVDDAIARHADANDVFIDIRDIRELQREGTIPGSFHAPVVCWNSGQTQKAHITNLFLRRIKQLFCFVPVAGDQPWPQKPCRTWA